MLSWNVIVSDFSSDEIKVYNIFNHVRFRDDIVKYVKQRKTQKEFEELVDKSLMYYFWSKSEWEILIKPWCCSHSNKDVKVDVYWQVKNNWEHFIEYLWKNRKLI